MLIIVFSCHMEWPDQIIIPLGERGAWPFHMITVCVVRMPIKQMKPFQLLPLKTGYNKRLRTVKSICFDLFYGMCLVRLKGHFALKRSRMIAGEGCETQIRAEIGLPNESFLKLKRVMEE